MRARTRNLLLLAAVAAMALLALILLRDPGRRHPRPSDARPTSWRVDGTSRVSDPLTSPPGDGGTEAGPAVPEGPRLEVRAVVDGKWGLAGIEVLAVERRPDGTLEAWIGEDAPDGGETDADGRITLRYKSEPAGRIFAVVKEEAVLEGAENADPAGEVHGLRAFKARSAEPVTLRYRDPDGLDLLRPVDAGTGEILAGRPGVVIAWNWLDDDGTENEEYEATGEKAPGWLRAHAGDHPSSRNRRLVVPGYLPSPAPDGGWKGRVVLPMKPDPAAVRGHILTSAGTLQRVELLAAADGRRCEAQGLLGLPSTAGDFVLTGVPPGEWDLVVLTADGSRSRSQLWATRRFTFRGTGLDLGDLAPLRGSTIRARLLSPEGNPVDEPGLRLFRSFPGTLPQLSYTRGPRMRETMQVSWTGEGAAEEEQGDARENGWVEFAGLRPGAGYLLATVRTPGIVREVTAPSKPEEVLTVDLDGGRPPTPCVLRFTLEGEEAEFWRYFCGPAYADQFSTGKGTLEADIPPGRYRFLGAGAVGPDSDFVDFHGEIDVPAGGRFEATVDLRR